MRMYALLEGSQDIDQYLCSIHRYVQIGIYVKGYYSQVLGRFQREIMEICEFYVDEATNRPMSNMLYSKTLDGRVTLRNPTKKLIDYLAIGNIYFEDEDIFGLGDAEFKEDLSNLRDGSADNLALKKTSSDALNAAMNGDNAEKKDTPAPAAAPAQTTTVQATVSASTVAPAAPAASAPAPAPVAQSQVKVQSPAPVAAAPAPAAQPAVVAPVATAPATTVASTDSSSTTVIETL